MAAATRNRRTKTQAETPRTPAGPPAPATLARIVEDLVFETLMACHRLDEARRQLAEVAEKFDPIHDATTVLRSMAETRARIGIFRSCLTWADAVRTVTPDDRPRAVAMLRVKLGELMSRLAQGLRETTCLITTGVSMAETRAAGYAYDDASYIVRPILDGHYLPDAGPADVAAKVAAALAVSAGEASLIVHPIKVYAQN